MKYWPWLRRVLALAMFAAIAWLFLADGFGAASIAPPLIWPQFAPSLVKFLRHPAAASAGWLAVIALTIFFGRIYCSVICPFGITQDGIARLFAPRKRRGRRRFALPRNFLRYGILAFTIVTFAAGSGLALRLLDPFSAFGRIMNQLCRPIVLALRWLAAKCLEYFDIYLVAAPSWPSWVPSSFIVALVTLVVVVWLAARHGRLYCNTICPVGAALALYSRWAVFRPRFDAGRCTGCRKCEAVCKADCLNARDQQVDMSRCVACYNCLATCEEGALRLSPFGGKTGGQEAGHIATPGPEASRRALLGGIGAALVVLLLSEKSQAAPDAAIPIPHPEKPTTIPEKRTSPVSPPGSGSIAQFTTACTACQLCVAVCPGRVLSPSLFEFGVDGMMQPRLDFAGGYCTFECVNCLKVCPTGAILPLPLAEKKLTQIGVAQFIKENCVVFTDSTACGACSEHCPTKAVDMVPYPHPTKNNLKIPEVKADYCLGCGACEHACPTRPYRAIFVDGHPVHKKAKKPDFKPVAAPVDNGEFPF